MSGLLMGALGGLGKGLVKQSERLEANERKRDYLEMQRQIDIEREKRIEEATIRAEGRREQASIRGEQRQAQNQRAQRHETLEFATDPDNVRRLTRAEIAKKQAADAYADRRAPIERRQGGRHSTGHLSRHDRLRRAAAGA